MRRTLAAAAVALVLGVAGCADDTPTGAPPATTTAPAPSGPTDLTVVWWPKGPDASDAQARRTELTVTCPERPADTDADCRELLAMADGDVFAAELPPGMMCTQQYGGPETMEVEGTLAGTPVTTTFTRVDGCQIARWDTAAPLLLRMGRG